MNKDNKINIQKSYPPAWEGETKGGEKKKIYTIIGPIQEITYRRLMDKNGIYLDDVNKNRLVVIRKY